MTFALAALAAALALAPSAVYGHLSIWHPSMYGFNVTQEMFPYDNRPVVPLARMSKSQWWWHNHQNYPPHDGDVFEWPAGGSATIEVACNKGYTSYWKSSEGTTFIGDASGRACGGGDPMSVHATSINDVTGCGIAIVDKSRFEDIKQEDFAVFTVNYECPWLTKNEFHVPADMPACTDGVCHCAWFWIHAPDAGGEQMFMNAFKCKVTNTKPTAKKIAKPQLARRCGEDVPNHKPADASNCTKTAMQPLYWFQSEDNNMHEGEYSPPYYNALYGFKNGAQDYIFTEDQGAYHGDDGAMTTVPASSSSTSAAATSTSTSHAAAATTSSSSSAPAAAAATPASSSSSSSEPAAVTSSSSSSSAPAAAYTPPSDNAQAGSSNANVIAGPTTGAKNQQCKRRTAEQKRKRDLKKRKLAAAAAHKRKRSTKLL